MRTFLSLIALMCFCASYAQETPQDNNNLNRIIEDGKAANYLKSGYNYSYINLHPYYNEDNEVVSEPNTGLLAEREMTITLNDQDHPADVVIDAISKEGEGNVSSLFIPLETETTEPSEEQKALCFQDLDFKAWPNPFSSELQIEFAQDINCEVNIDLVATNGNTLPLLHVKHLSKRNVFHLDGLQKGVYVLRVTTVAGQSVQKVVKI